VPGNIIRSNLFDKIGDTERVISYMNARIGVDTPETGLVLLDNYASVETLLNPVTLSVYNIQGNQNTENILNPYLIVAMWVLALGLLFGASTYLE
jgi:hypothetical protein